MAQESGSDLGSKLCSQCGERLEQGSNFCGHCGASTSTQGTPRPVVTGVPKPTGHIKYRNMAMQVILVIVTLGIYTIYWYYVTLDEIHKANGRPGGAGLWTLLSVIPIARYFADWHHSDEYSEFVDDKYPAIGIFILWIVFSPAVWFLVQSDLNRAAKREG